MSTALHEAIPSDPVERALVLAYDEGTAAEWLAHLYPGWRVSPVKKGWIAAHLSPITPAQRACGVFPSVGRARITEIAALLARMDETLDAGY